MINQAKPDRTDLDRVPPVECGNKIYKVKYLKCITVHYTRVESSKAVVAAAQPSSALVLHLVIDKPSLAGAVLQTPSSFIHSFSQ